MAAIDRVHSPTPEELMAYLDGESPADASATIESHLAGCAECQALATDLRDVSDQMNAWRVGDAPSALKPAALPRATAWTLPALSWRPGYLALSLGAVAMTAVLVLGVSQRRAVFAPALAVVPAPAANDQVIPPDGAIDRLQTNKPVSGDAYGVGFGKRAGGGGGGRPAPEPEARAQADFAAVQRQAPVAMPQETTVARQPSVIRTATLRLVASDFNGARASVEATVAQAGGFLDQITVNGAPGTAQTLTGSLRVPAPRLNEVLARLRQLGQVTEDTQGSEDVTDQLVDLDTRLANSRAEEQRLNDILKTRTGKLSDVLEVERQISRVRLEIEQMDGQRLNMGRRVTYATITLQIDEVRKSGIESGPLSLTTRLRVAAADGLESALESIVGAVLLVLRAGPATALWLGAAAAVWVTARRIRRANAAR